MSKLPQLTGKQRQAAVDLAGKSLALTSGAGCGKTLVLARRFTTLLLSSQAGDSVLERFVALTFTDKAALEMVARVRAVLQEALAGTTDPAGRQKLAEWITELPSARISTIHSFCSSLLRRNAIEARLDPAFAVGADEYYTDQMLSQSAQAAVLDAIQNEHPPVLELLAQAEVESLVADVETLLDRRVAWDLADYQDPQKLLARWADQQARARQAMVTSLLCDKQLAGQMQELAAAPCDDESDELASLRRAMLAGYAALKAKPDSLTLETLELLTPSPGRAGKAKAWGGREEATAVRHIVKDLSEQFDDLRPYLRPPGEVDNQAAAALSTLMALAEQAKQRYAAEKRRQGVLDFEDLIDLTARLLRSNESLRQSLRRRLSQLLIDECQDTDSYQLRMLWSLLSDDTAPPPGKLLVVGDAKQSIYRFRGAQAEVFGNLCGRFGANRLELDESFRTHVAGVAFVNRVFGELMGDAYTPVVSHRQAPPQPSVEILLADDAENPIDCVDRAGQAQAALLAQRIQEMVTGGEKLVFDRNKDCWRPVRYGDIAVLFGRMTQSPLYERALQLREVPYYVVSGSGFYQQQEVFDVLNALRVIDNPRDDLALLGVLRSSIFGLDDNALLHISMAATPPYFDKLLSWGGTARRGEAVSENTGCKQPVPPKKENTACEQAVPPRSTTTVPESTARQLAFAIELLHELHQVKDALGPARLIQTLLDRTGYAAVLLGQFHGRRKYGNVQRLLEEARSAAGTPITLADFIKRCSQMVIDESRSEQAAVAGEAEDVVRIMTIHKAKGLEFPVVFVPDLNADRRDRFGRLLFRGEDWQAVYNLPQNDDDADLPTAYELARSEESRSLDEEDIRKLYVATTRHEDHLVLLGANWRDKDGDFRGGKSYLARLDGVLGISAALTAQQETIPYGDGFSARLACRVPDPPPASRGSRPLGQELLAAAADPEQFAQSLARQGPAAPLPLLGPLLDSIAGAAVPQAIGRIAPTVLADFEQCPMLYRWRYELLVPTPPRGGKTALGLDAATAGSFFHRCLELLDWKSLSAEADAPARSAETLTAAVLAEMELAIDPQPLTAELADMLARLAKTPLAEQIRSARTLLTELEFLYRAGPADIHGRIDLLFEDAAGLWHVVDYKSDNLPAEQTAERAEKYRLQMLLYLAAARAHFGAKAHDVRLYFLRPAVEVPLAGTANELAAAHARLESLCGRLITCRRTGQFPRRPDADAKTCRYCPYVGLCLR